MGALRLNPKPNVCGAAGALLAAASDLSFNAFGYLAVLGNDFMTCARAAALSLPIAGSAG